MDYNLCIDIGNTNIKSGFFLNDKLETTLVGVEELEKAANNKTYKCIISNVRKSVPAEIEKIAGYATKKIILSHKTRLPVIIDYKTPETLGMDRVAAAIGAKKHFPGHNCIVIDAGTCITSDFIDKENIYHGGSISPGIQMRIKAMHQFTGALPLVDIKYNEDLLGKSSEEALQNGALKGTIWEISTFIKEINKKFGKSRVVFTGGDAKYFVNYFKTMIFADSNLILVGLNEILKNYEEN